MADLYSALRHFFSIFLWWGGLKIIIFLTQEDSENLERVQKSALRIILQERFTSYESALNTLELESLAERREILCIQFAKKCTKNPKMKHLFTPNNKTHPMDTRFQELNELNHANTGRLQNSPVIYMQKLLNEV